MTAVSQRFLRMAQVPEKTGLKHSQIYLYMKNGDFPKSAKIGLSSVAWLGSETDEWIINKLINR